MAYHIKQAFFFLVLLANLAFYNAAMATTASTGEQPVPVRLTDGTEISYTRHPARGQGQSLVLWLYSEAGSQPSDVTIADQLAGLGIEVWRLDLFEAHFLPVAPSSMDLIPDTDFAELIRLAQQKTGKQVYVVTTGRGAIPVLRGARQLQLQHPDSNALSGVILMSPKFFVETPDPGEESRLMPIVSNSNLPVYIMQPEKSPWFWKLDITVPALEKSGSDVFVQRIRGVRDRFYFRPDADAEENALTTQLPQMLLRASRALLTVAGKKRSAVSTETEKTAVQASKKERELKPYKGNPVPPDLRLQNLDGQWRDLKELQGKVVLVNFWASWCPPCVHEMPSMQALQKQLSNKPFTILAVNMAEDKHTIQQFLRKKINVSFPIIMDKDGAALKNWGVFAFPTSYVLDKKGRIRYALFGGVDWTTPEIINRISELVTEQTL